MSDPVLLVSAVCVAMSDEIVNWVTLTSELGQRFFVEVNRLAKRFMSDDHVTVGGTLIQACAAQKSFRRKDSSDDDDGANFHGQKG